MLDVLVPNNGKAVLNFILNENTLRCTARQFKVGNDILDNMSRLYSQTQNRDVKDLMFLLMCEVLTKKELNARITKTLVVNGEISPWGPIAWKKFKHGSTSSQIVIPYCLR